MACSRSRERETPVYLLHSSYCCGDCCARARGERRHKRQISKAAKRRIRLTYVDKKFKFGITFQVELLGYVLHYVLFSLHTFKPCFTRGIIRIQIVGRNAMERSHKCFVDVLKIFISKILNFKPVTYVTSNHQLRNNFEALGPSLLSSPCPIDAVLTSHFTNR